MFSLSFLGHHFRQHWQINGLLGLTLLIATTIVAGLPLYATAIADRSLQRALEEAIPAARNLAASGELDEALHQQLQEALVELYDRRVRVWQTDITDLQQQIMRANGTGVEVPQFFKARFAALDEWQQQMDLVTGRFPNVGGDGYWEVVVGAEAAEQFDLQIGDNLNSADGLYQLHVVGIVQPIDMTLDFWFEEFRLFDIERIPGGNLPDTIIVTAIVANELLPASLATIESWRILTHWHLLTLERATLLQDSLQRLNASQARAQISTGLPLIVADYQEQLATARISLFLLMGQSFIFVFYVLTVVVGFVLVQSAGEIAILTSRGFNQRQITGLFVAEAAFLALVAIPLGMGLARGLVGWWGQQVGAKMPASFPASSWLLSILIALFSLLIIALVVYFNSHKTVWQWQQQLSRPSKHSFWQTIGIDLFLLVIGGLAYWQLQQRGSFLLGNNQTPTADPILLLGPSVLLISIALVLLRLFPLLIQFTAWFIRSQPSFTLPLAFTRLARDPAATSRVVLLISLTVGLLLFASAFAYSVNIRQQQFAHYYNGADLRIRLADDAPTRLEQIEILSNLAGVRTTSLVFRTRIQQANNVSNQLLLLAVDPETFASVAYFPPAVTRLTIPDILAVLVPTRRAVSAVFSANAQPTAKEIGDQLVYRIGQDRLTFQVNGIVQGFPLLAEDDFPFVIVSLPALSEKLELERMTAIFSRQYELWIETEENAGTEIIKQLPTTVQLLGTTDSFQQQFASGLIAQQTVGAFTLNGWILLILSLLTFVLSYYFTVHQRRLEWGILRAIGMGVEQTAGILSWDGLLTVLIGLLIGTALGIGLVTLLRPFLLLALYNGIGGNYFHAIIINWLALLQLYGTVMAIYLASMGLILFFLWRISVQQTLRLSEE